MKKTFVYILFIINFLPSFSQNYSIIYGVELLNEKELFKSNQSLRNLFEEAIMNASAYRFKLDVNNTISKFYQTKTISFNNNGASSIGYLSFYGYSGESYVDKDSVYSQSLLFGNKTYVKTPLKSNWVLTAETKTIENFKCFKATNVYEVNNGFKIFKHPVTAWYCPEIPLNFGPNGYGNLPGLILELQVRNHVYGAKNINLNSNEVVNFDKKNITIINEKQMEEKLRNNLD